MGQDLLFHSKRRKSKLGEALMQCVGEQVSIKSVPYAGRVRDDPQAALGSSPPRRTCMRATNLT
jgi:hypothetical protein